MPTIARLVAAMEDKQTATLIAGISLARRTAYLERSVETRLGREPWRQAYAISLWAVEHFMELPDSADQSSCADIGFDPALLILDAKRQMQVCTSHQLADWGLNWRVTA